MKNERLQILPVQFEEIQKVDNRFSFGKVFLVHTGKNLKGSYFTKEVVEEAFPTLFNTPVLGYIKIDDDEIKDFEGHKHILIVEDGEYKLKYAGSSYGVIPESCNPRWEMKMCDDGIEREFAVVDCILWSSKFSDVKDIFDRDVKKSQSVELDDNFSGFERPDGFFEFSSITFHGACILGNSRTPAMTGASIEVKFSVEDFQQEIQTQMEALKTVLLNQNQNQNLNTDFGLDIDNQQTEGGNNVDEKLKLITNYSNLTEEDTQELVTNIEQYSLEEFDTKLKELSEGKEQQSQEFEMTNEQLITAIHKSLEARQILKTNYWNETISVAEFRYCDIKGDVIVTIDHTWSAYYGIPFSISGDNVVLDYDNKVEYLPDWRVKESGSTEFTLIKEIIDSEIKFNVEKAESKVKEEFTLENIVVAETQEYKDLQSKFETLEVEKVNLQTQFSTLETEKSTLETKVTEFETKITEYESQISELQNFQETTLTTQRQEAEEALFAMFSEKLSEDELKPFKETAKDFSIEQIEEKLSAFAYKKITNFEVTKQKQKVNIVLDRTNNFEIKSNKPYDDILEQYVSKE